MKIKLSFVAIVCLVVSTLLVSCFGGGDSEIKEEELSEEEQKALALAARDVLQENCLRCHDAEPVGEDNEFTDITDLALLVEDRMVRAGRSDRSRLIRKINDGDEPMPPLMDPETGDELERLSEEDMEALTAWIDAGAYTDIEVAANVVSADEEVDGQALALAAKAVLEASCLECHGVVPVGEDNEFVDVTDLALLVEDRMVRPGRSDRSQLIRKINDDEEPMPPLVHPLSGEEMQRLSEEDMEALTSWIDAGAPMIEEDQAL